MQDKEVFRVMIIRRIVIVAALVLVWKVATIQLLDQSYSQKADARTLYNKPLYPSRGLILDRHHRVLVYNDPVYTLEITENQLNREADVGKFCRLLNIDTSMYHAALRRLRRDRHHSPGLPTTFLQNLPPAQFAPLQEVLYEFGGISYTLRNVRGYPHPVAPHILGYISEVDQATVDASDNVYVRGDYIGTTGLERTYEKWLKGQKGVSYVLKDNIGREVGRLNNGALDSAAISGRDLITTIDLDLQIYAETLMRNKQGSIVCIEPSTGEILAMVSSPAYDPNLLTFHPGRSAAFTSLQQDSLNPLFDRSIMAAYPPGSIFKPILALIAMQEGVLAQRRTIICEGGYYYGASHKVGCHNHPTATNVSMAIQHSCNAYFVQVFRDVVESEGFSNPSAGLNKLNTYLSEFGLGKPLGIDLPQEKSGNVPTPEFYDRMHLGPGKWRSTAIMSLGIGQGELLLTTVQMANLAAILANQGIYITPHLFKAMSGDTSGTPKPGKNFHRVSIAQELFVPVVDGMERAVQAGTATAAYHPSISICGKTGTSQNPHGEDHSVFYAFAPKDNPKIAVAVYVENAGWGGTYAAPIASLVIEKYLTGEILPSRKRLEEKMLNANLIINP
jgi:penicillin-binding protein 2